MLITVDRFNSISDATISTIKLNRGCPQFFGLEDGFREVKVPDETRIPAGVYRVGVRTFGPTNEKYSKRYPEFHHGMLEIMNVSGFTDVLIHVGNSIADTAGCLLVAYGATMTPTRYFLTNSRDGYEQLYREVIDYAIKDDLQIRFVDSDRAAIQQSMI